MISRAVERALASAMQEARRRRHEYFCVEHLLYSLMDDAYGREVVRKCGADPDAVKHELERFFDRDLEKVPGHGESLPEQTLAFERVMQRAMAHVHFSGKRELDAGDLLAAILEEDDSDASYALSKQGITRLDILTYISHGIAKEDWDADSGDEYEEEHEDREREDEEETGGGRPARNPLEAFTVNLNQRAREGLIDPLIGREPELRRTVQVLCRRRKNNPVFVGEPGVGKTAIAEGLALQIVGGKVPAVLQDIEILRLDLAAMLAGTRFRGDFEQRMKAVIGALVRRKDAILFIDEIHTVVGAGSTTDSTMDASNMLKPVLASGELRCIGSTTYEEFKQTFEKDRALSRRFQKIEIAEPTIEETVLILRGLKTHYERHHGITYTDSALRAAAELSAKHINDRCLPDKAIDVIDEAGASVRLLPKGARKTIRPSDIEAIVAAIAKIPQRSVSSSDREHLAVLESEMRRAVFGQDDAIHAVATAIKRSRAGLGNEESPIGSFLFIGPTGVGKTEVARQLAAAMGVHFARYDMSEYMEKHAVARLIGAPPGYVGFDQGGLLTDEIRKHPYGVLLLDEIEKAHPDIFNILLQVMDHATLTDNNGKRADFRNVVLVMTSNVGARDMAARTMGFGDREAESGQGKAMRAVEKTFSPEFRNRLDAIVSFNALPQEVIERVVDKFIGELQARLAAQKVVLGLTDEARTWLANHGYDPKFGARPLKRLIQVEVKDRLTDELLFGKLEKGGRVRVTIEQDALAFVFEDA
ncbi:MAG: ATP-dependent Clp protease ATP-binding subunit ClpA [Candidatus Hydrogenedentes bacterium]|jgi:ATP-dependent Clp protease ATP-binding subunit ClpA|nr:ATP-dependent Clp protease ATP-binding subunit ClpA [Candidatus Hydrogenedentota bacterium]NLT60900.1 ATP-dependent Clp protease ATP-binding subunit ClpA [Candidatus Hydrogenedentota bacterium]HPX41664.1 ATP-dependent Clp protease ATP-binding subunit ClpA [Candidatus Hydrogenedentota bacterium]HQH67952.1 ATP-dependent Clp protease ATP-binding subunit ClpA [Candidatus Hydrogenedentota bacterium]